MAKRPPMSLVPRNRIWDLEYDIYCHLQNKNKVFSSSATDEKFNYFSSLLEEFHVPDTNNTAQEHAQFMDGLYSTVSTQMHHLPQPEPSKDETAEAEEEEEDNDGVVEDPLYKLFMDHLRPDGRFYALEITEGTRVFVRYHHEPSSTEEALALCVTENANHVSNDGMHAEYKKGKSRGRKPKGSNNGSGKNGVASSEPQNHDHDDDGNKNNNKKRKRGRPRKNEACIDKTQGNHTIDHNRANDDAIATEVKEEIKDYEHVHEQENNNVEYFWHDEKGNARKVSEYREKLLQELEKPYCEEEYERLLKEIACRKPVQHHKELRNGRGVTYEEDYLGKSFLDHNIDLSRKIDEFGDDHPTVLNLLRGFFFWLKNCSDEYAFMPWRDSLYYLDVVPQLRK